MENQLLDSLCSDESAMTIDSDGIVFSALEMMDNNITQTADFVLRAKGLLQSLDQPSGKLIKGTTIEAKRVIDAMIYYAPCDRGRRYAACSVVASCQSGSRGAVEELHALAYDWFKFLLLPFRVAYKSESPSVSENSTISLTETEYELDPVAKRRPPKLQSDLRLRDQNTCVVFSKVECLCPKAARIIRPSLVHGNDSTAGFHQSVPRTWDILRHYADIDEEMFKNIGQLIDMPENGMMLEHNMHLAFDKFQWYLKSQEEPNSYEIKWLTKPNTFFTLIGNRFITFWDASNNDIALPRRKFIQIHAAMAQVLHASGVGEFIDTLVDKFLPDSSVVPAGKFSVVDLDLRIFLANLADQNFHHLPPCAKGII